MYDRAGCMTVERLKVKDHLYTEILCSVMTCAQKFRAV